MLAICKRDRLFWLFWLVVGIGIGLSFGAAAAEKPGECGPLVAEFYATAQDTMRKNAEGDPSIQSMTSAVTDVGCRGPDFAHVTLTIKARVESKGVVYCVAVELDYLVYSAKGEVRHSNPVDSRVIADGPCEQKKA